MYYKVVDFYINLFLMKRVCVSFEQMFPVKHSEVVDFWTFLVKHIGNNLAIFF